MANPRIALRTIAETDVESRTEKFATVLYDLAMKLGQAELAPLLREQARLHAILNRDVAVAQTVLTLDAALRIPDGVLGVILDDMEREAKAVL